MQRRENLLYVGMNLHKESHTAVLLDCWNEKLGTITIENKPSHYPKLTQAVNKIAADHGLQPIYGLENAYGNGRALTAWLIGKGYVVKDVNAALGYDQRKSAPSLKKSDEYDAHSVAIVLINQLHHLPDAKPEDKHWTLSQLVNHREQLVSDGVRLKNALHRSVSIAYPSYKKFFCEIDSKTALYFWQTYPSPEHLADLTLEELQWKLKNIVPNTHRNKAGTILEYVQADGATCRDHQEVRDFITMSMEKWRKKWLHPILLGKGQLVF